MMSVSPDHHQGQLSSSGSSSYLPNYLLGGTVSPSTTPQFGRSLPNVGNSGQSPHGYNLQRFSGAHMASIDQMGTQKNRVSPLMQHNARDKSTSGPPVEGLYDNERNCVEDFYTSSNRNTMTPLRSMSLNTPQRSFNTPGSSKLHTTDTSLNTSVFRSRNEVLQSPAQLDPFYTQGESLTTTDILDETWVTIFGFPPSLVGFILEEFSHYGSILQKTISNNVNWLHIQYQTKLQAKKALSKNGKILNGNMMIGVCQCIDKEVMMGKRQDSSLNRSSIGTPSSGATHQGTPKQSSIRPLTAAYHAAANQNKIVQDGKGTPQRNNSVISRAMEYVFGL